MDPETVFKAYDVRGRVDNGELDEELYRLMGSALVSLLQPSVVAIGRDCRSSSPAFFAAMASGVTQAGADVVDLGLVPTDAVYYYSGAHSVPGGVITASHNPPNYNGLKLCRPGAAPIGRDTGLAEIKAEVEAGRYLVAEQPGVVVEEYIVDDYVDHLLGIVPPAGVGRLRVAVDGGNGMAGIAVEKVFSRIEAEMEGLYLEPDGTFPNHPADPLVEENLADLRKLMEGGGFDLGVAFDGDADRAFFLDDQVVPLSGSTVTSLLARRLLVDHPGAAVVHNLITSRAVPEIVTEAGGVPVRTRVGHSFIKQVMAESGAIFGGEHSGHYYFRDNFKADSGMLAMLVLMEVMSEDGRPLSQIRKEVERYHASGEINFEVGDPLLTLARFEELYAEKRTDTLDGLTVELAEGWFNLRPSNTEPLIRLNVEAASPEKVEEIVDRVSDVLEAIS